MHPFEQKVFDGLKDCGVILSAYEKSACKKNPPPCKIGVGVSGGADSVSLLLALCSLSSVYNFSLYVITVNHFMRPNEQTCGDARFVLDFAGELQKNYPVKKIDLVELEKGQVASLAKNAKCGDEAAARKLRYQAFDSFILNNHLNYFCLAHNQNDQVETLLMRFLQGSCVENRGGIPSVRSLFIRPLLNLNRKEIESYLKDKNQPYRTDLSNFETEYTRNKIRQKIIPLLDENFPGWKGSVIAGAERDVLDGKVIGRLVDEIYQRSVGSHSENGEIFFEIKRDEFSKAEKNLQSRVILRCVDELWKGDGQTDFLRFPSVFMEELLSYNEKNPLGECKKSFSNIVVEFKKEEVFIKKEKNLNTDLYFSAIIEEDCNLCLPFADFSLVSEGKNKKVFINGEETLLSFSYPVCLRSVLGGDEIMDSQGTFKKVSHILSSWHVLAEDKEKILVIQELNSKEQPLICILGRYCGFKDWILKE